ncbi:MAG: alpha/beta fold hydrolase [Phycisphaerales bacterium]|nr:MAG: alpha/beta fold hydrolase [Phycisphaerales bacterium]
MRGTVCLMLGTFWSCTLWAGCALHKGPAADPSPTALDEFLDDPVLMPRREGTFAGSDGRKLGFVAHCQSGQSPLAALVYLHGIESHAAWFDIAGELLRDKGYDVFCLDRRGSGVNRENRGFVSGHADSYRLLLEDVRFFVQPLRRHYEHVVLVGLSWGGKQAVAYTLTYPHELDGLILITPGLRALVDAGPLTRARTLIASGVSPRTQIPLPIEAEMFTTTPVFLKYIQEDPLRLKSASARFLVESHRMEGYIDRHMPKNRLPILLFLAGQDRIIDNAGVLRVLERGGQDVLDVVEYEDQTHSIQFDAPERLVNDMARWIGQQCGSARAKRE